MMLNGRVIQPISRCFFCTENKTKSKKTPKQAATKDGLAKHLNGEDSAFDNVHGHYWAFKLIICKLYNYASVSIYFGGDGVKNGCNS